MNRPVAKPGQGSEWATNLGLIALAGFIPLGGAVWLAGEIASRLSGNGSLDLSFSELGGVLVRLVINPTNPSEAFPPGKVTSPLLLYAAVAALLLMGLAMALAVAKVRSRFGSSDRTSGTTTSSWATPRQLQPLAVKGPEPGRLILGRSGQTLVAAEERQSAIVLGPTQSMKTSGFAIPAILEWEGPVVATSVKTDLLRDTLEARRLRGEVWIYDPTSTTGLASSTWSPLQFCHDWHGAQRTAMWLARAAQSESSGIADADFWYQAAAKLLGPLMYAAANSKRSIREVVAWVDTQEENELRRILLDLGAEQPLQAAQAAWLKEPRQKSSIYTTAETILMAYGDPIVAASAASSQISPRGVARRGRAHPFYKRALA